MLTLPASGIIYVDTSILIYSVEKYPEYLPLLQPMWLRFQAGDIEIVTSELTLMETLVGPIKNADTLLATAYENLLLTTGMQLIPITQPVLKDAARLRAENNLKTPDAIHAATAFAVSCTLFITNDYGFRNVPGLRAVILREVLAS